MGKNLLSIIIIAKNEENNITRCLDSVIVAAKKIDNPEILVVDGASNDRTVEFAKRFPVKIIQLKASWLHTASAGRFLGIINTQGKYVFIIDADMELIDGFLEEAIKLMEEDQAIAGVAGISQEVQFVNDQKSGLIDNLYQRNTSKICAADYLGGAALFRRCCLEEAGSFNPYLYSQEELELCLRLKQKWKILTLPYPMTIHYTFPYKSIKLFKKHLGSNRFTGMGQLLRYSLGQDFFWLNFFRFKKFVYSSILIIGIILSFPVLLINKNRVFLAAEAIALILFYLYLVVSKRSLKQAFVTSIVWLCIIFTFVKGFFLKPKQAADYPQDVKIIKG